MSSLRSLSCKRLCGWALALAALAICIPGGLAFADDATGDDLGAMTFALAGVSVASIACIAAARRKMRG